MANKKMANQAEKTLFQRNDGDEKERAICFSVCLKTQDEKEVLAGLEELKELAHTAGAEVLAEIYQNRDKIDAKYYIGVGKLAEIKDLAEKLKANCLICDDELSPAQLRNIEDYTKLKIIDRSLLILDIFAGRATSAEGKLQVALAQAQYRLPRIQFMLGFNSRLAGGIGTRGPGESLKETDRRHIQRRINTLREKLAELGKKRQIVRQHRTKSALTVAVVGYTNAGKSSLINSLCKSDLYTENQVFATLDPACRHLWLPKLATDSLLIDTVGFIRKLPHHLIEAFKSTLEEAAKADLLLLVLDAADPQSVAQLEVVENLLKQIGAAEVPRLYVANKMDLLHNDLAQVDSLLLNKLHTLCQPQDLFFISVKGNFQIEKLRAALQNKLQEIVGNGD